MNYSPFESERLFLADPSDPRIRRDATELDRVVAALTGPELLAFVTLCVLGLMAIAALCFLVLGFGETAARLLADRSCDRGLL
jgi:hypothetical protein